MEINIRITKEAFEQAIPAAREPKGAIFGKLQNKIDRAIEDIAVDKLGDVGIEAANNNLSGKLATTLRAMAAVEVFLREMRDMDLVLTSTGFGVVSTNDTAPASKLRVDALDGELRVKRLMLEDALMEECFTLEGWYDQGLLCIDTLFCFFKFLRQFAGMQAPISKDWELQQGTILRTESFLREKISDELFDDLIMKMAKNALNDKEKGVVHQIRRIVGVAIQGRDDAKEEFFRRLMNTIERNLEEFPAYANSLAFQVNHSKPYENHKEDSAFHFVG